MLIDFRTLFPKYGLTFTGVLHCGANIGEEAPVYDELGIKKQIWIEANPALMDKLKSNISKYPDAMAFCFAAGETDGNVTLHIANNGGQSSSVLELGTHKVVHPEVHYVGDVNVPMYRMDSFFKPESLVGVDLLNLDCQGFEGSVLRGLGNLLKQFKAVYTEVNKNEVYKNCMTLDSMDLFMTANGFQRVELYNNGGHFDRLFWTDALYLRK
jgi:FkbM family methyltransferase